MTGNQKLSQDVKYVEICTKGILLNKLRFTV